MSKFFKTDLEIGDVCIFNNGVTPPETIEIEKLKLEPDSGEQTLVAVFQRTSYDVRFLTKKEENQNAE